jgi:hypothetical protein
MNDSDTESTDLTVMEPLEDKIKLPAIIYKGFFEILEERIKAHQAEMDKLNRSRALYEAYIQFLRRKLGMINEVKIDVDKDGDISTDVTLLPDDLVYDVFLFTKTLGEYLHEIGLRRSKETPNYTKYGHQLQWQYSCLIGLNEDTDVTKLYFRAKIPPEGTRDYSVVPYTTHQSWSSTEYRLEPNIPVKLPGWSKPATVPIEIVKGNEIPF